MGVKGLNKKRVRMLSKFELRTQRIGFQTNEYSKRNAFSKCSKIRYLRNASKPVNTLKNQLSVA